MSTSADHRRIQRSWCLYDWANSAFATTVMAALFPPFYRSLATEAGLAPATATAYWGYTTALGLLAIALVAPVLGALADQSGRKKRFLGALVILGVAATALMTFIPHKGWRLASVLYGAAAVGFAGANIFYDAFLPHIAREDEIDRVSTRGFALGYVGGGLLLCINVAWVLRPHWFGLPDVWTATKASFASVALWWAGFSLPLFRDVPEPPAAAPLNRPLAVVVRSAFRQLATTLRELKRYRQLLLFLAAFWIYNDGIGTIIKMATAYGDEIGIGVADMTLALILTQFVGIPCAFGFGWLAGLIGTKRAILLSLAAYALISMAGYWMRTTADFFALALAVGAVQGGSQALSRSLYGTMVPRHQSAEFFGFYSTSSKFAGIFGPLLFGLVSQLTGSSRGSIVSLVVFFILGGLLLFFVDEEEGRRVARAAERAVLETP